MTYISANFIKKNKLIETILPYIEIQPSKSPELSDQQANSYRQYN